MDPITLLLGIRGDLRKTFSITQDEWPDEFLAWLVFNGINEYPSLRRSSILKKKLLESGLQFSGLSKLEEIVYSSRADLQSAFPLPERQKELLFWFSHHLLNEYELDWLYTTNREIELTGRKSLGVNVFGYAYGASGIGEDFRTTLRALESVNIPSVGVNFDPGPGHPQRKEDFSASGAYEPSFAINIFCMTAPETARYCLAAEQDIFAQHYNVGYWPWELEEWPAEWTEYIDLVDEVWVSSRYIYDALMPVSKKPVLIMPLCVTAPAFLPLPRQAFGLPSSAFLFVFAFDLGSSSHRKNPKSCLEAFWIAFPRSLYSPQEVGLIIKVHPSKDADPTWEEIKSVVTADERIFIIEETFAKDRLYALYDCCDCFLSFHRAEGYGRNIAEALCLGLHVIATGHSGNLEFCNPENSIFPKYALKYVGAEEYTHASGRWAEVDVEDAAKKMKDLFFSGKYKNNYPKNFPFELDRCAARYKNRLNFIFNYAVGGGCNE